ncbi:MAG: T9SS type A sorting domain-containing protein, partial [Maribacter sp.]
SGVTTLDLWFFSNYGQQNPGSAVYDNLVVRNLSTTPGNLSPVADAGNDVTVEDTDGNGTEAVTLDGGNSTDIDGTITSYTWRENGIVIATGATPSVGFSTGVHNVTLTVTDNGGASGSDTVRITVTSAVTVACTDDLVNDDPSIALPSGTFGAGVDSSSGTTVDTNGSPCALLVSNNDAGQPWGSYRIAIRLSDYGISVGDELLIGVDGKSLTGTARLEINRNNAPNTALGFRTFGNDWSRYETTVTVPSGVTTLDLWFFSNYGQQNPGSAVYDNLVVRNLSAESTAKSLQEAKPLNALTLYPNPANVETTLSFDQPTSVGTIEVFDVTGRLVRTMKGGLIDNRGTPVNVQEMPVGVYFVKTTDSSGVEFQQKMLIQRQ